MAYLRKRDYFTIIRERDLDEILSEGAKETAHTPLVVRQDAELDAIAHVETMIRHRYDVEKIFRDIIAYDVGTAFQIGDLVEYTEPAYDPSITYAVDDRRSHKYLKDEGSKQVQGDDIFKCKTTVSAAEDFDIAKWTLLTENGAIYYCETPSTGNTPDTAFAYSINNFTGNHESILGWDKTKTIFLKRLDPLVKLYYTSADQAADSNSIGIVDFDPVAKDTFPEYRPIERGTDEENTVSGDLSFIGFVADLTTWNVVPTNFFTKGFRNADRVIRALVIDIAIFNMHKLISPRNIPDLRMQANDDAMMMLSKISKGQITPDLPVHFDDTRGDSVEWNSIPKNDFRY